jgi:hypothetical protein
MILVRIYLTTVLAFAAFNFACWSFWPYLAPAGQEWGSMIVGAFPRKLLVCKLHILFVLLGTDNAIWFCRTSFRVLEVQANLAQEQLNAEIIRVWGR